MPEQSSRRPALPDFRKPPLNEVVLGVQFMPPRGYQQIRAGEVWGLFRSEFPLVEEHPPLPPIFETFGLTPFPAPFNFGVVVGAQHDRFWFLAPNKEELIQFQQDRLLHNWRKVGDSSNEYPRFESMISRFEDELLSLEGFFSSIEPQSILCNQVEISYVNHIPVDPAKPTVAEDWVRFVGFGGSQPDDIVVSTRDAIVGASGAPFARMQCDFSSAVRPIGGKMYVLTLTVRGAPFDPSIPAVLDFLKMGRELIVNKFASMTTESAHAIWERLQ